MCDFGFEFLDHGKVRLNCINTTVQNFTNNGKCSRCGGCCNAVLPMTEKELHKLKRFVKNNHVKPRRKLFLSENSVDGTCPFLSGENMCMVYPVRPSVCRQFTCEKPDYSIEIENIYDYRDVDLRHEFGC